MPQAKDEAGNIWETDENGNPIRLLQAAQQQQAPQDPAFPFQGQQAAASASNAQTEANINAATAGSQISKAGSEATAAARNAATAGLPEGFMWDSNGQRVVAIPGYTRQGLSPEVRQNALKGYSDGQQLAAIADKLEKQYNENFKGGGVGALGEYSWLGLNPREANKVFNDTADQARGFVKGALGYTGGEGNTIGEVQLNYGPYLPQAGDRDAQIVAKIAALRDLAANSQKRAVSILGGIPDAAGNIQPLDQVPESQLSEPLLKMKAEQSALSVARQMQNDPLVAAAFGQGTTTVPIPPQMQAEHSAFIAQGNFTPEQYANFRAELDRKYGFPVPDAAKLDEYRSVAPEIMKVLQQGGEIGSIPPAERQMTGTEFLRNNLISNPIGAGVAGFTNMVGVGGVEALAPDQYGASSRQNPTATTLGEILGAVGGTEGIGAIGRNTVGRAIPGILGGEGKAQFLRNLATDATYGAGYGTTTQGDPVTGAVEGTVGSVGGQALGKTLGAAVRGAAASGPARTLRDAGVRLTGGQILGGPLKAIEDRMLSVPILGDIVRQRRIEGMQDFNQAAFREAGQPIGVTVDQTGPRGLDQLNTEIGNAYDNATSGVNIPLDQQFNADMAKVAQARDTLPPDYAQRFDKVGENRIGPIVDAGQMTGDAYQQAVRGLKGARSSASGAAPGFEQEYRDAITQAMDAIDAQMKRGGSPEVLANLAKANETYRNYKTLADAVGRARNGTRSGEIGTFAPSQLNDAIYASGKKYNGQPVSLRVLADAGQEVLPSRIPDSGTAGRVAQMLAPGLIGGGAAGIGAATSDNPVAGAGAGAGTAATLGALLSLMATRQGQAAVRSILMDRNPAVRKVGDLIAQRAGIGGAATLPFVLSGPQ